MSTPFDHDQDGDVLVAPADPILRRPSLWQVVLHNDDFTPMDFVVVLLMEIFSMPPLKAEAVMLAIHQTGRGVAGVFTREVAELKIEQVRRLAEALEHPLMATLEKQA